MTDPPPFTKYWDDLAKHEVRLRHWLPSIAKTLSVNRRQPPAHILALLSVEMIDAFLFVSRGVLEVKGPTGQIAELYCIECEGPSHQALVRMIGARDQVFWGKFEEIVGFHDDPYTEHFRTVPEILAEEEKSEFGGLTDEQFARLELKRAYLQLSEKFPFDFINLDLCDAYYLPPDVERIHKALETILEWQERSEVWRTFSVAVTWRHCVSEMRDEAKSLLVDLATHNIVESREYAAGLRSARGISDREGIEAWSAGDSLDFCSSLWPKDVLELGAKRGWQSEVEKATRYERWRGSRDEQYHMISGVFRFTRAPHASRGNRAAHHLEAARMLDKTQRPAIGEHLSTSPAGSELLHNLTKVWELRNTHAKSKGLDALPPPKPERHRLPARRKRD